MARTRVTRPGDDDVDWALTRHLTAFVNAAFGRRLRPSLSLYDAVRAAVEAGYTGDEIRLAFWVARCGNDAWLKDALRADGVTDQRGRTYHMGPDVVLRHKGGLNTMTGNAAKRWLDDLLSRASETSPALVAAILRELPAEMRPDELSLLQRMEVLAMGQTGHDG